MSEVLTTSQRLHFFDSGGRKILWCDYSKSGEEQMLRLLEQAVDLAKKVEVELNILTNFRSTPKCPEFNKRLKAYGKEFHQSGIHVKVAVLGIDSPLKRVVVNATMAITRIRNVKLFEGRDEAIAWLISN